MMPTSARMGVKLAGFIMVRKMLPLPSPVAREVWDILGGMRYHLATETAAIDQTGIQYVNVGETLQLSATVVPATAATALTWKSSRVRYATVDGNGCVTGVARGTCKITVMTANKKKASVTVKVLDPYAPAKVAIAEKGPITLHVGETAQLTPLLTPTTSKTTFTWLTNKARIATVSDTGLVTAVKKGTAKITVRTSNKKKATIVIKVVD